MRGRGGGKKGRGGKAERTEEGRRGEGDGGREMGEEKQKNKNKMRSVRGVGRHRKPSLQDT